MDSSTSDQALESAPSGITETFRKLGPARLGIMGAVLSILLIFFVFLSLRVAAPNMELLYGNLTTNDSSVISLKLDEAGIKHNLSEDGTQLFVEEEEASKARLLLAQEGLPNSGSLGYEVFDNQSGFGTTNFQDVLNKQRAMEGELARTISSIDKISTARVHLVLPERELFSRETQPASGSVFLNVKGGAILGSEQILSIQSLVASAVPGMKAANVSVMDSEGNLLARGGDDDETALSVKAENMRQKYEQRLTRAIEDLVGRTVGFGNVRAVVTADLNFDRISENEEIYDPESQVIRSSQLVEENASETEPFDDSVSVENNLPNVSGDLLLDGQPTSSNNRVEETTNYEISKIVRNTIREAGEVKKLSVAVMVDGTYVPSGTEGGETIYQPRSVEEIAKIENLVKSAIGYTEGRGDIITVESLQFADIDAGGSLEDTKIMGFERADLLDAAEIVTVAIMIILVILLVLQPMVGKLLDVKPQSSDEEGGERPQLLPGMQANPALAAPDGSRMDGGFQPIEIGDDDEMIDMARVQGRVKASSLKKVEDIVNNYPSETVSVLRGWMTQD